jgi:hypothetical protein
LQPKNHKALKACISNTTKAFFNKSIYRFAEKCFKMTEEEEKEAKKSWRFRWLGLLFEFSHLEYQRGLWIEHKYPNEIGWFAEDMCQYFDDLSLDDDYNYSNWLTKGNISEKELKAIETFHLLLRDYDKGDKTDAQILEDPEWISIVNKGKERKAGKS